MPKNDKKLPFNRNAFLSEMFKNFTDEELVQFLGQKAILRKEDELRKKALLRKFFENLTYHEIALFFKQLSLDYAIKEEHDETDLLSKIFSNFTYYDMLCLCCYQDDTSLTSKEKEDNKEAFLSNAFNNFTYDETVLYFQQLALEIIKEIDKS